MKPKIGGWETEDQKLSRFIKIPPKKKLEWLYQMHQFIRSAWTKKQIKTYLRLRETR